MRARESPAALLLTGHHAQTPAVLDHSRALPQGDGSAGPAFTRRAEGGERNLIVLDACDVLDNAFAVRRPGIDAEGEVISRRGHVRLFYPIRLGLEFKERPRLPKRSGLEWDSVRPLKSPVSPSAPTRNVAFGSAPCLICALGYHRSASRRLDV